MPGDSNELHEPADALSSDVVDRHRALASLTEELEAVDWYDQRVSATRDESLAAVLAHNRDEEKEHAAMVLEWLRRNDPRVSTALTQYLMTKRAITDARDDRRAAAGDLGIRSLHENKEVL
jgi:ferritin-like protein